MTVHAVRGIREGEEVLTSYVKPFQRRRARERQLEHCNFRRGCEACEQRGERWMGSDKRRKEMWKLFQSVKDYVSHEYSTAGMLFKAKRLLELLDEEGLLGAYVGWFVRLLRTGLGSRCRTMRCALGWIIVLLRLRLS